MKNNNTFIAIIFVVFIVFSVSCNKYEEGPAISLLTKKARITGIWEFSEKTPDWGMAGNLCFEKDGTCYLEWNSGSIEFFADRNFGEWEFDNKKENLLIKSLTDSINNTYEIIKLTNKELKLQVSDKKYTTLLKCE